MSEPKLVSPLLDGFRIGEPISDHCGVRCCPAMPIDSEEKYIIKIISLPATQVKLDALLLTGAFQSPEEASCYFQELASNISEEAAILQRLAQLEGFTAYDSWQIVPMDEGQTGYEVYLKAPYRSTLERLLRRESMTHLSAVNLGLDLCNALATCRRSGYLYVALKPENITLNAQGECRICDLGFLSLNSLEYACVPERCLSAYTPPEIKDAFSAVNTTVDVYAAGLILYQAYNGGSLPFEGRATDAPLSAPKYADAEMAQIILKACDPNPEVRWQDPYKMGQALVEYMQSHSINDTPIVPAPAEIAQEEVLAEEAEDDSTDQLLAEVDEALVATDAVMEAYAPEESAEEEPAEEEPAEEEPAEEEPAEEEPAEEEPAEEESAEEEPAEEESAEEEPAEEDDPSAQAAQLQETLGVGEEVSQILVEAEEIIAHALPEPAVAPEPIHVELPLPTEPEEAPPQEIAPQEADALRETEEAEEPSAQQEAAETEIEDAPEEAKKSKLSTGLIIALLCLAIVSATAFGIYTYYQNIYLQTVYALHLRGQEDRLTVTISTTADAEDLTVFCVDTYGNTLRQSVINNQAVFKNLNPSTRYTVYVEIDGFHKLTGNTTATYATGKQTEILDLTAVTGGENGSVILNFTVQGVDAGEWIVRYSAEGEEEKTQSFTGHMVTLTGLTVGKEYTFRLEAANTIYLTGKTSATFRVSNLIFAENLQIQGFRDQSLTITWSAPQDAQVESWVVRCYNDLGYNRSITVYQTSATFTALDAAAAYTIEVTAAGMNQGARAYVSANSITVSDLTLEATGRNALNIQWEFEGPAPEGGWLIMYSIDGDAQVHVLPCNVTFAQLTQINPGSVYTISIKPADGSTVFGGTATYEAPPA